MRLELALVLEVNALDVADQPLLGPLDAGVIEGGLQRLDLGEESVVDHLVVGGVRVAGLHHHALLILEVVVCDVIQLREETNVGGILGAVEDALEDGLVLSIDVVVHHTEGLIPHVGVWNLERHDVGCDFGCSHNKSTGTLDVDTVLRSDRRLYSRRCHVEKRT
ncbi:hypothetical protein NP493_53g07003 [Ridgeia piscesae]|uniref:Uncharacterized protein n=1 Tax=Ridgeia piscesae TaxID=27915 RepID=A0AAD9PB04_RIDPI|nr:hypothetical protein NP493_53g07003 [Ridgeia piscesae]